MKDAIRRVRRATRDANEPAIITALQQVGAYVWPLHDPYDLTVQYRGRWFALEVKNPQAVAKTARAANAVSLTSQQVREWVKMDPPPIVVCSPFEALLAIGALAVRQGEAEELAERQIRVVRQLRALHSQQQAAQAGRSRPSAKGSVSSHG